DVLRAQLLEQRRAAEAVREVLLQHALPGRRRDARVDLYALGVRDEEGGARPHRDVLHVEHGQSLRAERGEQAARAGGRRLAADELHLAAGEVVVLDVDDQQRLRHGLDPVPGKKAHIIRRRWRSRNSSTSFSQIGAPAEEKIAWPGATARDSVGGVNAS